MSSAIHWENVSIIESDRDKRRDPGYNGIKFKLEAYGKISQIYRLLVLSSDWLAVREK